MLVWSWLLGRSIGMRNSPKSTPSEFEFGDGCVSITKQFLDRQLDAPCAQGISGERVFVGKKLGLGLNQAYSADSVGITSRPGAGRSAHVRPAVAKRNGTSMPLLLDQPVGEHGLDHLWPSPRSRHRVHREQRAEN
jgi:hypothetical protein